MNETENEAAWIRRAKAGDLEAFEALTTQHERQVFSLALRMLRHEQDAEDVTQQTFLSALEHLTSFREESSFTTWLLKIATHAALKIIRKRRGVETVSIEQTTEPTEDRDSVPRPEYIADWRETPAQLVQRKETRQMIDDALDRLHDKHRLVFILRDVEGLSVQETAETLSLTESNVKVRLLRARLQLRELLTRDFGDPERRLIREHHH
jgi:RNA polymerase sigma-70 factor, ECF subfamily